MLLFTSAGEKCIKVGCKSKNYTCMDTHSFSGQTQLSEMTKKD